jgi:site-specific recombinase XerD
VTVIAPTLEAFFTERLISQRRASPHTVAAYRDSFRLLLGFAQQRTGKAPSNLEFEDLDAPAIAAFLEHLERARHNSPRSRNARLAAVHSLYRFAALRHPEHAALIQRVLAIPPKRFDRTDVSFLTHTEAEALLAAPDRSRWIGRRDYALLAVAIQTGLRVSELCGLRCQDVQLGAGANLHCHGKGRRERCTPLMPPTAKLLAAWMHERAGQPGDPLFPTRQGRALSPDAVQRLVRLHTAAAAQRCLSLRADKGHPHALRHTTAMDLLQAGVDVASIALFLGHANLRSVDSYLHADSTLKERALARTAPHRTRPGRYRPPDRLLAFLEAL